MYKIDSINGKYAVAGGAFLGGGGGGSYEEGLITLDEALKIGEILVKEIEDFEYDEIILTASAVGSPASKEGYMSVEQVIDNFEFFKKTFDKNVAGIITNENGGHSTTNGWILSAATGIPLVDAPCNGRAHPTGVMGSMGLENIENYIAVQTAAGGKNKKSISTYITGNMDSTSKMIRQAAVEAGGLVTVLRNPVEVSYVKENAAPHSLKQAIDIGKIFVESKDTEKIISELEAMIGLEVVVKGEVAEYELVTEGGFDHGYIKVKGKSKSEFKAYFWNEFMAVDNNSERIVTFPDLIGCINVENGKILTSATIKKGDNIYIYKVSKEKLILGAGMKNKNQFKLIESILGLEILRYAFKGEK